ncbi:phage minor head protein, partial [Rhodoplanes elegans]
RAARAAGQWNRIQRTKRALPYLLYVRSASERKRPEHLRWVGTILPVDHPFWSTHFPPNGWNCKCSVRQLDKADRDDYLSRPKSDAEDAISYDDTAPDLGTRTHVNRRTGEVAEVPVGIDPGWDTNPGLSRARTLVRQLHDQLDTAGPERAARTIAKLWGDAAEGAAVWPKAIARMPERVHVPVAASARVAAEMETESAVVAIASDTLAAKTAKHARVQIESFGLVQRILDAGEWLDGGDPAIRHVLAVIDGVHWVLAMRRSSSGYVQVRTLFAGDARRFREIRAREERGRQDRMKPGEEGSVAGGS